MHTDCWAKYNIIITVWGLITIVLVLFYPLILSSLPLIIVSIIVVVICIVAVIIIICTMGMTSNNKNSNSKKQ